MRRKLLFFPLLVMVLLLPLQSCAFVYSAEPIEGWVVDAETGKPLEGVNIVAHWQLRGGVMEDNPIAQIHIDEAITDQNGRYAFKGWGPKFALLGHLRSESPGLIFFKSGYKYLGLLNMLGNSTSKSDWNKKTVKMERFKGTLKEYAEYLSSTSLSSLWYIGFAAPTGGKSGRHCGFTSFPQMLRALDKLESEYRAAGITHGTVVSDLKSSDNLLKDTGCGSVFDILGGGKK